MHELSIVANLFEIMEEQASSQNALRITRVKLQVGILSGVVPELLKSAFDIYKKDTIADTAEVEIRKVPLRIKCEECGSEQTHDDFLLMCGQCGSSRIKTLAGTDLILEKMEVEI